MGNLAARGKATLSMKITRKDGTVEVREVERDVVRDENGQVSIIEETPDGRHIHAERRRASS